jgi:hypothetical protein
MCEEIKVERGGTVMNIHVKKLKIFLKISFIYPAQQHMVGVWAGSASSSTTAVHLEVYQFTFSVK